MYNFSKFHFFLLNLALFCKLPVSLCLRTLFRYTPVGRYNPGGTLSSLPGQSSSVVNEMALLYCVPAALTA